MIRKIFECVSVICLTVFFFHVPSMVFAGNPPDQSHSSISGTQAPADGLTSSSVTIVLRDSSGNTLSGNDSILITSTNSTTSFNPSSVTMNGSGTIYTQMKSSYVGSVPVTVTDQTANNTQITGYVYFYQPGTAPPGQGACTDPPPGSDVQLKTAVSSGPSSITLTWVDATNPVTSYLLAYGLSSGNYQYGNPNIGGQGTTSYTVGGLTSGTKYYFVICAVNGCTPGNYSNELSAASGISTTPTPTPIITPTTTVATYNQSLQTTSTAPTPVYTPVPTPTLIETPVPQVSQTIAATGTEDANIRIIVLIATVLGVLILAGIVVWIYILNKSNRPPPVIY